MAPAESKTEQDLLAAIDVNIGKMIGSQNEAKERIAKLEKDNAETIARLKAADETIKSQREHFEKIEAEHNRKRFGAGGGSASEPDALRNALPDDLKPWVVRASSIEGGPAERGYARSSAIAELARRDPVKYVASGGWFRARIKAALATRAGHPEIAAKWNEYADKLVAAMGGIEVQARAALQEDTNAEGGFLIPTITEAMIGWLIKDNSVVRASGATMLAMTTKEHKLPTLANDFVVNWIAEEATIPDAEPAATDPFGQGSLIAKKLGGLVTVSIELVQDNIINLMDFILTHLVSLMGREEDKQALEGDGTVFTGLLTATGVTEITKTAAALAEVDLRKLIYGGEHSSTTEGTAIWVHPWIVRDAMGFNTPNLFGFPFLLTGAAPTPRNIWGVPTFTTSVISRTRAPGTETVMYHGRPSMIIIGERMGSTFDVNPWSGTEFAKGQIILRLLRRVGVLIWVPQFFTRHVDIQLTA